VVYGNRLVWCEHGTWRDLCCLHPRWTNTCGCIRWQRHTSARSAALVMKRFLLSTECYFVVTKVTLYIYIYLLWNRTYSAYQYTQKNVQYIQRSIIKATIKGQNWQQTGLPLHVTQIIEHTKWLLHARIFDMMIFFGCCGYYYLVINYTILIYYIFSFLVEHSPQTTCQKICTHFIPFIAWLGPCNTRSGMTHPQGRSQRGDTGACPPCRRPKIFCWSIDWQ